MVLLITDMTLQPFRMSTVYIQRCLSADPVLTHSCTPCVRSMFAPREWLRLQCHASIRASTGVSGRIAQVLRLRHYLFFPMNQFLGVVRPASCMLGSAPMLHEYMRHRNRSGPPIQGGGGLPCKLCTCNTTCVFYEALYYRKDIAARKMYGLC